MMIRGMSSVLMSRSSSIALIRWLQPVNAVQAATIAGKASRGPEGVLQRPPPFPYNTKKLRVYHNITDRMLKRFNENTKLLVVEGNVGAGKSALAKQLAEELDMLHMPEANLDTIYVNEYGKDFRDYQHVLPDGARVFSVKDFYERPNHKNVAKFQVEMFTCRLIQYVDALTHIMNTGQGVVMERCIYSDVVFMEAMRKFNYLSKGVKEYYEEMRIKSLPKLMRPHLVIYLDVPVNVIMDRIKKRNIEHEVKSKVLTKEYLTTLEDEYRKYLNDISEHAELLAYDWSTFGDVEVVVEDIERIDFDKYDKYDKKLIDWRIEDSDDWAQKRYFYTNRKHHLLQAINLDRFDVPEVLFTTDEAQAFFDLWDQIPGNGYAYGFNVDVGDKNLLFKTTGLARKKDFY